MHVLDGQLDNGGSLEIDGFARVIDSL